NDAGTYTAITADNTTPNTRNGVACVITDTKIVVQVWRAGAESTRLSGARNTTTRTSRAASTSTEPIGLRRRDGGAASVEGGVDGASAQSTGSGEPGTVTPRCAV